jgi:spore germination protein GerM
MLIALLAGGATAWLTWQVFNPKPVPQQPAQAPAAPQPSPSPLTQAPTEQTVQVYWLKTVDNTIAPTASPITVASEQPNALLEAALQKMLTGSDNPELTSTIPAGTKLRQVQIESDGVHVDLSQEFTSGGGSTSMTGRLAQVIYTATTLNPEAPVWISVEGKPLEVLGGEGLIVDQPMTRESFKQNYQF